MNLDTLRAKAEAAKAWRPDRPTCDRTWSDRNQGAVTHCGLCASCLGAQRAVDDIGIYIDAAIECFDAEYEESSAHDQSMCEIDALASSSTATTIASYFASEPNPVSEFRDAVREACK